MMKTIQTTIDETLLKQIDAAILDLGTTRSAFVREALQQALKHLEISALERQHMSGYEKYPINPGEFDIWENEQIWEAE